LIHFIRKKEDFTCENCGTKVAGNGYTNHCPNCLYSKHVDNLVPGDRDHPCHGPMKPIGVELVKGSYTLLHRCLKCGKEIKNKTAENDNFEEILRLTKS